MLDDPDLRSILDLAPAAMLLLRADRTRPAPAIVLVNEAFSELTGLAAEALIGRSLRALRTVTEPGEPFNALLAAAANGEPFDGRLQLRAATGTRLGLQVKGQALRARPEHYAVWLDQAAGPGWAARQPLGEPARLLAGLSRECFYELVVDLDCRLRLTWADPRIEDLTGYSIEELQSGGGLFELVGAADRDELQRRNQRLLAGQPCSLRYRLRRKNGELRWVQDTARPERVAEGEFVARIVGTLADVSESWTAALPVAVLERQAAMLAGTLGAFTFVADLQGRVHWTARQTGTSAADLLHDHAGRGLAGVLPARILGAWLDWFDEAVTAREPVRCTLWCPASDGEEELEAYIAPVGEDRVQVALWSGRSAPEGANELRLERRALLDLIREPLVLLDVEHRIVELNAAFERLFGRARGDLMGQSALAWLPGPGSRELLAHALGAVRERRQVQSLTALPCAMRGGERALDLRISLLSGGAAGIELIAVEARRSLRRSLPQLPPTNGERWFDAVMDNVADGVVTLGPDGTITWLSRSAEAIFDYPRDAAIGASIDILLTGGSEAASSVLARVQSGTGDRGSPLEMLVRRRSGELIPIELEATRVDYGDRPMTILTARDITVRRQTEETLRSLAYHDPLTGLPNRLLFHDRLSQAIERARRNRQLLTVMLVDLDRFKLINDSLGLERGDQVLKLVAERLLGALRRSDTVARLGGDEFMVLLLGTNGAEAAAKVAQKILESLKPPLIVDGHELATSASIGIALFPHDGDDAEAMIKNADNALSRAKEQGRSRYQFYTDDMNATAFERLMLESRLRKALEHGEFVIDYQPKVSIQTGSIVGVEALLRWFHPDLGLVPPGEFIPLAEETGLIVPIGAWVIRAACAQVRRWHQLGFDQLEVAVNLSARQFQDKALASTVAAAVEETGLPGQALELELTESVVMRDAADAVRRLRELTALGIRCVVDDFGTGYSSLSYLKAFPISALKIDRSFVRDIDHDANSAEIARAIVALASSLNLKVVAEGVETKDQLERVRALGCHELQGYLFSRPLPPEELLALLQEGRRLAV